MQLTKELLLTRRAQATKARENLIAQANAQAGMIDILDHLLAVLDQPEPPTPPAPTPPAPAKPALAPA